MWLCPCFRRKKKDAVPRNEDRSPAADAHNPPVTLKTTHDQNAGASASTSNDNRPKGQVVIFSYHQLAQVTNNFDKESIIGEGGFGPVYKGTFEATGQIVAVKQLNHLGRQGNEEFSMEVRMLSNLRHPHIVNLIGYCSEGDHRLLVYRFMPLGSVGSHLHDLRPDSEPLDWKTRMTIAAGTARGLNYLHNEATPPIIFRDLKTSNILLEEGFHPRLSDFGLATYARTGDETHVPSTAVGTEGYCAPEYAAAGELTVKSDVFSYGVVLLELITGQRPIAMIWGRDTSILYDEVLSMIIDQNKLFRAVDRNLRGKYP